LAIAQFADAGKIRQTKWDSHHSVNWPASNIGCSVLDVGYRMFMHFGDENPVMTNGDERFAVSIRQSQFTNPSRNHLSLKPETSFD
jgi:hypothetical protein